MEHTARNHELSPFLLKKVLLILVLISLVTLLSGKIMSTFYTYDYAYSNGEYLYELRSLPVTFAMVAKVFRVVAASVLLLSFLLLYPGKPMARILLPLVYVFVFVDLLAQYMGTVDSLDGVADEVLRKATVIPAVFISLIPAFLFAMGAVCALTGLMGKVFLKIPAGVNMVVYGLFVFANAVTSKYAIAQGRVLVPVSTMLQGIGYIALCVSLWIVASKVTITPVLPVFAKKNIQ